MEKEHKYSCSCSFRTEGQFREKRVLLPFRARARARARREGTRPESLSFLAIVMNRPGKEVLGYRAVRASHFGEFNLGARKLKGS